MAWATIADVKAVTGLEPTAEQLAMAVFTLETMTGLIEAVDRPDITDRDRHWLKLAACYQTRFVIENPDLFSRLDVTSAAQDGQSANFRNPDAHLLAPLARKSIRRLSWRALTRPGDRAPREAANNVLSEEYDDSLAWKRV